MAADDNENVSRNDQLKMVHTATKRAVSEMMTVITADLAGVSADALLVSKALSKDKEVLSAIADRSEKNAVDLLKRINDPQPEADVDLKKFPEGRLEETVAAMKELLVHAARDSILASVEGDDNLSRADKRIIESEAVKELVKLTTPPVPTPAGDKRKL